LYGSLCQKTQTKDQKHMRNIRKVVAALGVSVVASLATSSVALAESASGSGATFPQNFLANATVNYNAKTGHNVTYANPGGGSTKGKSDFKANLTDFGGSDSAVTSTQAATFDWVYVPYVGGAISVAYRLDEIKGATLSLSSATVNGIFTGLITKWNDSNIAADMRANPAWSNSQKKSDLKGAQAQWQPVGPFAAQVTVSLIPSTLKSVKGKKVEIVDATAKKTIGTATVGTKGELALNVKGLNDKSTYDVKVNGKTIAKYKRVSVTLPDKDITVVYRSDGSGTTNNFTNFLREYANNAWTTNDSFTTAMPGGSAKVASYGSRFQGQSGSANVSNYIADNSGTIGFTEVSFVTDSARAAKGMQSALIKNAAGIYVAPTAASAASMIAGATVDAKGFVTFDYKQASNKTGYPIVAITYLLGKTAKSAKNAVVADFAKWMINDYGPTAADALGYAPLAGAIKTAALAQAAKVNSK
jgi:ABC-type phosphate transport system substrate-binding protein